MERKVLISVAGLYEAAARSENTGLKEASHIERVFTILCRQVGTLSPRQHPNFTAE